MSQYSNRFLQANNKYMDDFEKTNNVKNYEKVVLRTVDTNFCVNIRTPEICVNVF